LARIWRTKVRHLTRSGHGGRGGRDQRGGRDRRGGRRAVAARLSPDWPSLEPFGCPRSRLVAVRKLESLALFPPMVFLLMRTRPPPRPGTNQAQPRQARRRAQKRRARRRARRRRARLWARWRRARRRWTRGWHCEGAAVIANQRQAVRRGFGAGCTLRLCARTCRRLYMEEE